MSGSFDEALDSWREFQGTPWGRLRFSVAEANLRRHLAPLGPGPLRVLDLAGADGGDALRLAAQGHEVTVVDFSPGMLAAARQRADEAGLQGQLTTVEADVLDLPGDVAGRHWDVVLCHNLLQYLPDPRPALQVAADRVRPGGVLSVMAINRHAAPLALAVRSLDPAAALAVLGEKSARGETFDAPLTLYTAEELTPMMAESGCTGVEHCGIRTVNDHIVDDERKHDPEFYAALEALETALSNRHPYPHTAKILHLLGRMREHPA